MTFRHFLVPTDGSELSLAAARIGAPLAKSLGAKITTLYVIAPFSEPFAADGVFAYVPAPSPDEYHQEMEAHARASLAKVAAVAKGEGVAVDPVIAAGVPWRVIIDTAESRQCDLIVMASHGQGGIAAVLMGSETTKVLTHSKIPVLVCR